MRGLFFYFDPNEKCVSKFTFVRTKLQFMESEKSTEAIWKQIV